MATWNVGPFDNDDAVDWCERLEASAPESRQVFVRQTLETAARQGADTSAVAGAEAIAAAATVLQALTGVQTTNSPYAPRFLLGRRDIQATPALCGLAVRAIDSVLAQGSAWRVRWAQDVEEDDALTSVKDLRAAVAPGPRVDPATSS
jgi:hypothetical protein